jgi:hypothetical protein
MAHFAELDESNIVIRVIVVSNEDILDSNGNESEEVGINYCVNLLGGQWIQTSYNGNIRKNYASFGDKYDSQNDFFIAPKPFDSWVLNKETAMWDAPVDIPNEEGKKYQWSESDINWIEII